MHVLLQKLNTQLGREDVFKMTNEGDSLNANSIISDAIIVIYVISKNPILEIEMFPR